MCVTLEGHLSYFNRQSYVTVQLTRRHSFDLTGELEIEWYCQCSADFILLSPATRPCRLWQSGYYQKDTKLNHSARVAALGKVCLVQLMALVHLVNYVLCQYLVLILWRVDNRLKRLNCSRTHLANPALGLSILPGLLGTTVAFIGVRMFDVESS